MAPPACTQPQNLHHRFGYKGVYLAMPDVNLYIVGVSKHLQNLLNYSLGLSSVDFYERGNLAGPFIINFYNPQPFLVNLKKTRITP